MRIAGIDLSTMSVDIVTIQLDGPLEPRWYPASLGKKAKDTSWETVGRVKQALDDAGCTRSMWDNIAVVYIEDPHSFGPQAAKALGLITGAVRALLPDRLQDRCHRLAPQEWRVLCGLKAKASKEDVAAHADALGFTPGQRTQDAVDAWAVALAGRALCEQGAPS